MNSFFWKQVNYSSNYFRSPELLCKHVAVNLCKSFKLSNLAVKTCKKTQWAAEMALPAWCGSGHGFSDETGMLWHSGSSVLGILTLHLPSSWSCAAAGERVLLLLSSLPLGPCRTGQRSVTSWHGVTALCHTVGQQPALHSPCSECVCGFGAGKRGWGSSTACTALEGEKCKMLPFHNSGVPRQWEMQWEQLMDIALLWCLGGIWEADAFNSWILGM